MHSCSTGSSEALTYEIYSVRRGRISTHESLSAAVIALWIDRTSQSFEADQAQIFELGKYHARLVEQEEYTLA